MDWLARGSEWLSIKPLAWAINAYHNNPIVWIAANAGFYATCFLIGSIYVVGIEFISIIDKSKLFIELAFYGTLITIAVRILAKLFPLLASLYNFSRRFIRRNVMLLKRRARRQNARLGIAAFVPARMLKKVATVGVLVGFAAAGAVLIFTFVDVFLRTANDWAGGDNFSTQVWLLLGVPFIASFVELLGRRTFSNQDVRALLPAILSSGYLLVAFLMMFLGAQWVEWHFHKEPDVTIYLANASTGVPATVVMPAEQGVIAFDIDSNRLRYITWDAIKSIDQNRTRTQ